jgi:hypothetical protein
MIEAMPDQNWQEEIRTFIEQQSVKKKRKDIFFPGLARTSTR